MPHDETLDPIAILAALGFTRPASIAPVSGGSDTAIWRVTQGERSYALRVFRPEQLGVCRRETAAMELARAAGLPVPGVHAAGFWREHPALLLSWCAGAPLLHLLQRQPWRVMALGRTFGRSQARIHQVSAATLAAASSPDAWITWARPIEPALQTALHHTAGNACALLHLDYHPLNVLANGTCITAVLDWANARAGDPRADAARTYALLALAPISAARQPFVFTVLRRVLAHAWRRGYEAVAGPLRHMEPFYAWAGVTMLQDLAPRLYDPQEWLQPQHLVPLERWTAAWQRRAYQLIVD